MRDYKIAINQEKIQAICFNNKIRLPTRKLQINGQPIPCRSTAKYLGLTYDKRMSWKAHIDGVKKREQLQWFDYLYPILKNEHLNLTTKLMISTTIARPTITYALTTWGCAANTNINKIQVVQNKILRIIVNALWLVPNLHIHRELGVSCIIRHMKETAIKVIVRAENHENDIIQQSLHYNMQDCRVFARRPRPISLLDDGPF